MSRRGTALNIGNRFTQRTSEPFDDGWGGIEEQGDPRTEFLPDSTRTAFATNDSPDIPFTHSINPYRGCEHGCAYCYARPTHEYLGFDPALEFETKIMVKHNAARLARAAMMKPSWKPTTVSISGVTDPYQPAERRFGITRSILEVMLEFRNPVAIVTKNALVTRDVDLLAELAAHNCAAVFVSITTLDRDLARRMEPRTSTPERRLGALRRLADAGVPVGVMTAPIIPGLNDEEIPAILTAAADAGARHAGYVILRLPLTVRPIFLDWLQREEPARVAKVTHALEDMRDGNLNIAAFGRRMGGSGPRASMINDLFRMTARRLGMNGARLGLTTEHFRRPAPHGQTELFG